MKIGITERGDAGIDFGWESKLDTVDGAILITKNITEKFKENAVFAKKPVIVHCTCTGFGGTPIEPKVPDYKKQLDNLVDLTNQFFPVKRCVLRIDPIIPTEKGLAKVRDVLDYFSEINPGINRIRISVLDEYKHVKKRFIDKGLPTVYGENSMSPSKEQLRAVADLISQYPYIFETCAEDELAKMTVNCKIQGCISKTDIELMGLECGEEMTENPQNRNGCHCLSCKTELLTNKTQCPHKCLYCYWKDR